MNKRSYIITSILLVFGLCIFAGCAAQQEEKYTRENLDNLAEIRIYSTNNNELIKTISDEEQLYQFNQCSIFDGSDIEERQDEWKRGLLEENTTITFYEDTSIVKMTVAEESIKAFSIPEEYLTFYYELSQEEINFYHSLVE